MIQEYCAKNGVNILEKDGVYYALNGWNGEKYYNCYKVDKFGYALDEEKNDYIITPIYQITENDEFILVDYNIEWGAI